MNIKNFCDSLNDKIKNAYESSITVDEAEKLSAEFLYAQLKVSDWLSDKDLDSRMRKSGLKAIRATAYMEAASKGDKKPSDTYIDNVISSNETIVAAQKELDEAEVERDRLERCYDVYREAHVYFRQLAKGGS